MADTLFAYGFRKQGSEDTDELGDEDAGASKQEEDGEQRKRSFKREWWTKDTELQIRSCLLSLVQEIEKNHEHSLFLGWVLYCYSIHVIMGTHTIMYSNCYMTWNACWYHKQLLGVLLNFSLT